MNFKHVLSMSVLYVSALFSSYKPLKFGNSFYPGVFLCGSTVILFVDMNLQAPNQFPNINYSFHITFQASQYFNTF